MNKNAIQRYAVWARTEMIAQVSQRAYQYGITAENFGDERDVSVGGRMMTETERKQRNALISEIRHRGYETVMEEVAYTWFNRLIALRFMEVNNYLPSHVRVFSDASGAFKPEILSDALHLELPGLEPERVAELIEGNRTDDLYRYLLLTQCNVLNRALPRMFEEMGSYTELLLPNNILRPDSVIGRLVTDIPEADWTDQVQIIGWLYQYYNTEPKNAVFAGLKQNKKIEAEDIPAATQLFTPDWIVRYMVENSLGRLWLEGHPNDALKSNWRYYLDEAEQESEVRAKLDELRAGYAKLRPEEIKVIDPCCGSGHIAVYMFDVLMQIYESQGWTRRDAVRSILENNLYALDIDDRAAQLAYFAVMMKAREYDRRFLTRKDEDDSLDVPQPNVFAIPNGRWVRDEQLDCFGENKKTALELRNTFEAGKEFGSLLGVDASLEDLFALRHRMFQLHFVDFNTTTLDDLADAFEAIDAIEPLIKIAKLLKQQYDVVVTNPPYMAVSNLTEDISSVVKKFFPTGKGDLFAAFIDRCIEMVKPEGYQAMITQHAWMFLSSYEGLRERIRSLDTVNMAHLGARAFEEIGGEVVQTTSFVLRKGHATGFKGTYMRLVEPTTQQGKEDMFLSGKNRYVASQENFAKIPGAPVAYWVSDRFIRTFEETLGSICEVKKGSDTGENDKYVRFWYEVDVNKVSFSEHNKKWIPYLKGGEARKWYGHLSFVVNWDNNGFEIRHNPKATIRNEKWFYQDGITWSDVGSNSATFRYFPKGCLRDNRGPGVFTSDRNYVLGLLNSIVCVKCQEIVNPTICFQAGSVKAIPYVKANSSVKDRVNQIVEENISISHADWDAFETSWDFQEHPLVMLSKDIWDGTYVACMMSVYYGYHPEFHSPLEECFLLWQGECQERFNKLKANEEELNRIFIDIYGLQDELTPEVDDKDVTVRRADLGRDIRSLISYAVGCMFGRYSLDTPGLAYAGGGSWDADKYRSFQPDPDNIIPICDDDYFDDDITGRFVQWVEVVYGKETLEANLKFIADALGGSGTPREVIRRYFLNDFHADHLKVYQKRPIYWLFDSGKKNGFKALIYLHRYRSDLLARLRTDYVHEQQERYRTQLKHLSDALPTATASERVKLTKRQKKLQEQALEVQKYEERVHHLADQNIQIDLDDGVKINYAKFEAVLAKIK